MRGSEAGVLGDCTDSMRAEVVGIKDVTGVVTSTVSAG